MKRTLLCNFQILPKWNKLSLRFTNISETLFFELNYHLFPSINRCARGKKQHKRVAKLCTRKRSLPNARSRQCVATSPDQLSLQPIITFIQAQIRWRRWVPTTENGSYPVSGNREKFCNLISFRTRNRHTKWHVSKINHFPGASMGVHGPSLRSAHGRSHP